MENETKFRIEDIRNFPKTNRSWYKVSDLFILQVYGRNWQCNAHVQEICVRNVSVMCMRKKHFKWKNSYKFLDHVHYSN